MEAFTIRDLENLSGIKAHTIRIWEQRYSFLKPQRTDTNIRMYSNEELKTLLNVALLNKSGYKISHIDKMDEAEMLDRILSIQNIEARQERVINDMIACMIDMDAEGFEQLIEKHIHAHSINTTLTRLLFPFLERIGVLWQTGHINPAQEHMVSNIIRQKLIVGIDSAAPLVKKRSSFLLFLPEGEHHELGLLFVHYLLKVRGVSVVYLGANVPIKDAEFVINIKQPDYIYIHLTSTAANFNLQRFFQHAERRFNRIPTYISGVITTQYKKEIPPFIHLVPSLAETVSFIDEIS